MDVDIKLPDGRTLVASDWIEDTVRVSCAYVGFGGFFPLRSPRFDLRSTEELFLCGIGLGSGLRADRPRGGILMPPDLNETVAGCDVEVVVSERLQFAIPLADLTYVTTPIRWIHIGGLESYEVRVVSCGGEPNVSLGRVDLVFRVLRRKVQA